MCKLNGEVGGIIDSAAEDLDKITEEDGTKTSLPIKEIIRNLVYEFGEEPYHNIVINDLQEDAVELLEYRYNVPMFLYKSQENKSDLIDNIIIGGEKECKEDSDIFTLNDLTVQLTPLGDDPKEYKITFDDNEATKYAVSRVDYGMTAGLQLSKLIYGEGDNGALTANIGEPLTSLLDKIVNFLGGNYEYFYNLDGQFVFQLKESFTKTMWGNKDYIEDREIYDFNQGAYIISLSNTPDIANLKNDFSIWGNNSESLAIHYRYTIDQKPFAYKSIRKGKVYAVSNEMAQKYYLNDSNYIICDWREIIYQMADDYFKCHTKEDFTRKIKEFNPILFPLGKTKYEQYYRDMQGFWRDLYIDPSREVDSWSEEEKNKYYTNGDYKFWNKDVYENPHKLKFFIDFLESGSIQNFGVRKLGRKPYVKEEKNVKAIDYKQIPNILYLEPGQETNMTGYKKVQMQHIDQIFSKVRRGTSAKEAIEQCLYKYAYCNEAVNITCSPIFDLKPNSSILLSDKEAQVNGEYIVDKINLSLNYNGNMTITAIKAAEQEVII